jgi:hypothetical protein
MASRRPGGRRVREGAPRRGERFLLELKLALGAPWALVPVGLVVLLLMHTGLGGGSAAWAAHWAENCEAFIPIGFGIGSSSLLLVEHDEGTVEMVSPLPMPRLARARVLSVVGGMWILVVVWLLILRVLFGPVPFFTGMVAALGSGLLLGGASVLAATVSGRVALGYLVAIGVPVLDLVLQLLGVFRLLWPLQFINVFAYRWATPEPGWMPVKLVMVVVGIILYLNAMRRWRGASTSQLG